MNSYCHIAVDIVTAILPLIWSDSKSILFTKIDRRMWWYFYQSLLIFTGYDHDGGIGECDHNGIGIILRNQFVFCAVYTYSAQWL